MWVRTLSRPPLQHALRPWSVFTAGLAVCTCDLAVVRAAMHMSGLSDLDLDAADLQICGVL